MEWACIGERLQETKGMCPECCQVRGERRKSWQAISRADEEDRTGWVLGQPVGSELSHGGKYVHHTSGQCCHGSKASRDSPDTGRRLITQDNQP